MKYLFVHQNFPGQYLHLVRHLAASKQHDVVFITEPNAQPHPGRADGAVSEAAAAPRRTRMSRRASWMRAVRRAEIVAHTAANLKQLGFEPDIIIGHHGWGELLNLRDVWPDAPLLGYLEFYYCTDGIDVGFDPEFPTHPADYPRIRAKNAVNLLALNLGAHGQTPTKWQLSTYPAWAQPIDHAAAGGRQPRRLQAERAGAAAQSEDRQARRSSRTRSWSPTWRATWSRIAAST